MTLFPKLSMVAAIGVVASGGWYQAQAIRRHGDEISRLNQHIASQQLQIERLGQQRDEFLARAAEPIPTPAPSFATGDVTFDSRMESMVVRVNQLRKWLDENPRWKIPELQFLRDSDWFEVVAGQPTFDASLAVRNLRTKAVRNVDPLIRGALKSYAEENDGQLPMELSQLMPFFVSPIDEAVLQRYEMRAAGPAADVPKGLPIIGEKAAALAGPGDNALIFTESNVEEEWLPFSLMHPSAEKWNAISKAYQAFRNANQGAQPPAATELLPYFQNPKDAEEFAQDQPPPSAESEQARKDSKDLTDISLAFAKARMAYSASHNGISPAEDDVEAVLPYFEKPEDGERWKNLRLKREAAHK